MPSRPRTFSLFLVCSYVIKAPEYEACLAESSDDEKYIVQVNTSTVRLVQFDTSRARREYSSNTSTVQQFNTSSSHHGVVMF